MSSWVLWLVYYHVRLGFTLLNVVRLDLSGNNLKGITSARIKWSKESEEAKAKQVRTQTKSVLYRIVRCDNTGLVGSGRRKIYLQST